MFSSRSGRLDLRQVGDDDNADVVFVFVVVVVFVVVGDGGGDKDGNDEYLMRLDTAGVERKPPLPTISLETLLAAAILISKINIMILMVTRCFVIKYLHFL